MSKGNRKLADFRARQKLQQQPEVMPLTFGPGVLEEAMSPAAIKACAIRVHDLLGKAGRDKLTMPELLTLCALQNVKEVEK